MLNKQNNNLIFCFEPKPKEGGLVMSVDDYFWKAFKATGSPQLYMMYTNKNRMKTSDDERDKRNANL